MERLVSLEKRMSVLLFLVEYGGAYLGTRILGYRMGIFVLWAL